MAGVQLYDLEKCTEFMLFIDFKTCLDSYLDICRKVTIIEPLAEKFWAWGGRSVVEERPRVLYEML